MPCRFAACLLLALALPCLASARGLPPIDGDRGDGANATGTRLLRAVASDYADGVEALAGPQRPSARHVSNALASQSGDTAALRDASDYLWQWGQFLDHDLDLTESAHPLEPADIPVPTGDPDFDPFHQGDRVIPLFRSVYDQDTGAVAGTPRQQVNQITGWMDASMVYGSDRVRAEALRAWDGSGRLATSDGDLLPFNTSGLPNAGGDDDPALFLAGDVRANEQVALTAMHTLFVREHNRLVDWLGRRFPRASGDALYHVARRLVIAQIQVITYREFLPALLGRRALPRYRGYRPRVDPRIANLFSTAAFRFGHSALSPQLLRLGPDGAPIPQGPLALRDAFFAPEMLAATGIDPILRGLAFQVCQRIDGQVVDDVRNFLFGPPGAGGFDLAALNLQRGRDHGLPSYNDVRRAYGLRAARSFADLSRDPDTQARLAEAYAHVDDVDVWAGGLAEDPRRGSHLGPLFHRIVVDQFTRLRDGDRHHWRRVFPGRLGRVLGRVRLSDVIRRNTGIGDELPDDVFHVE